MKELLSCRHIHPVGWGRNQYFEGTRENFYCIGFVGGGGGGGLPLKEQRGSPGTGLSQIGMFLHSNTVWQLPSKNEISVAFYCTRVPLTCFRIFSFLPNVLKISIFHHLVVLFALYFMKLTIIITQEISIQVHNPFQFRNILNNKVSMHIIPLKWITWNVASLEAA